MIGVVPDIPRWVVDAAAVVAAVATIGLAVATLVLAFATRKLAQTAAEESKHLATQADATAALAKTSAAELEELKIQNRQRPLLYFEQRGPVEFVWEPGAETEAPKTRKKVTMHFTLRIENLGGPAFIDDARIVAGDGTISFESPRKLVSPDRDYLVKITYDAVSGTPYRYRTVIQQPYRAWNSDETFVAHVLVALASDWYDMNDPWPTVIPLDRPDRLAEDADKWAGQHFQNYDDWHERERAVQARFKTQS